MENQISLFEEETSEIDENAPEFIQNAWKKAKQDMKKAFSEKQMLPYDEKLERQKEKAYEFLHEMESRGFGCHVSVGGLDSITLFVTASESRTVTVHGIFNNIQQKRMQMAII